MLRHIAYVSSARSRLTSEVLSDILDVSVRNNRRDGITGVLMYHNELFFQILEGESQVVEQCYRRICDDSRHTGISETMDETVSVRSFPDWLMGYVGPDKIDEHTDGAMLSLAGLREPELSPDSKRGHALELAKAMYQFFSKR